MAETSEIHRRAVRNFERVMRFSRRAGAIFAVVGIALLVADLSGLRGEQSATDPFWWYALRHGACQMGMYLLGIAYLYPQFYPVYREPVTEMDQQDYHKFLYGFARPMKEQLRDIGQLAVLMLPLLIIVLLAIIGSQIWPEDRSRVRGIAALAGFAAFVITAWLAEKRQQEAVDAWYAANFPSGDE